MNDDYPEDSAPDLQHVLNALDDEDCRSILGTLDTPMTAQELMEECDLSQTTTYRKLELLGEAGLLDDETEIRDDGHHSTLYERNFVGVAVWVNSEESFDVTTIKSGEGPDERLSRFWQAISEEL